MNYFISLIAYPLGWIMWLLYSILPNYGVVILCFTLITKILLFPMSLHQHKAIIQRTRLQPQMNDIKAKYGNNPQKYQQELMALYQKEGVSPAAGCGTSLIQLPIIFGMLGVVYAPLKYILRLSDDVILKATQITENVLNSNILSHARGKEQYIIINTLKDKPDQYLSLGNNIINKILGLNFNFLGLDLSNTPSWPHSFSELNWLILLPLLSGVTSFISSWQMMRNNKNSALDDASQQAAQSMKVTMWIMPIFSVWISFTFPAGISLYWIFSNIFMLVQNYFLYKKYNPAQVISKAKLELDRQKEQERLLRIESKKKLNQGILPEDGNIFAGMSQKEINKVKLANARKRDALKYGDYND